MWCVCRGNCGSRAIFTVGGGRGSGHRCAVRVGANALVLIPVWMGGWASNNKFALIGAMRAVAQSVSLFGADGAVGAGAGDFGRLDESFRHRALPNRSSLGGVLADAARSAGVCAVFLSSLAEAKSGFLSTFRKSELIAGITTEYTGMKFGLFYMAEYIHTLVASAVASALFLGGWMDRCFRGCTGWC